ncbi:MAG: adenylate/guanylate cyclase domain-containing protein [Deltaproteobacteria bacterium]|nr:adenylate/guanylate cyclase domain-containing protein [Deltaproteobacteria bacterium]
MTESPSSARWLRSRIAVSLAIGLGLFAVIHGARESGWLVSWEVGAYDNHLRLQPRAFADAPVTVVTLDEADIARFGHPLSDRLMAEMLAKLGALQPRAIGIDVYRDVPVGEGREELRTVFNLYPQLVAVDKLADDASPAVAAPEFLTDRRQIAFADVATDTDGIVRRGLLYLWAEDGAAFQSLAFKLAATYLYFDGVTVNEDPDAPGVTRFGETSVPPFTSDFGGYKREDAGGYQYLLDYRLPAEAVPHLRLADVLDGNFDPELVTGRVVLVGTTAPSVKDSFSTPTGFFDNRGRLIFGVEHHALAVDQLIRYGEGRAAPMAALSESSERLWILAWCLMGALVGLRCASLLRLVALVVFGVALLGGGCHLAFLRGFWLPLVPAVMGSLGAVVFVVAYQTQMERADRARAISLFGKFVSRSLVDTVWEQRDLFMDGDRPRPQRVQVTLLLSDLFGYTSIAEKADPSEVLEWLGEYTDRMAKLVEDHGGMVNDFLGDGLMATFGVPVPRDTEEEVAQDAVNAVECALAMQAALEEMNEVWRGEGRPTARLRVGILTGPAAVGHIGSSDRMKYATVGNTVNTAARLETHDKLSFEEEDATCRVLIGQATLDCLGSRFETKCIGDHVLKGRGEPVTIHRVYGFARRDA